ncbi:MAG: hypothetical protein ACRCWQ_09030 [Bacilli bacterium]
MIFYLVILTCIIGILGFYVFVLTLRIGELQKRCENTERLEHDIEELMSTFMFAMKEENDKLITALSHKDQPTQTKTETKEKPKTETVTAPVPSISEVVDEDIRTLLHYDIEEEKMDVFSQAKKLASEGRSVEEIARTLGKGVTEIQLMLTIRK